MAHNTNKSNKKKIIIVYADGMKVIKEKLKYAYGNAAASLAKFIQSTQSGSCLLVFRSNEVVISSREAHYATTLQLNEVGKEKESSACGSSRADLSRDLFFN